MATLADKEKIVQYLKERPDGATFTNIMEEIGKSSSVAVYMLNTLQKEGRIAKDKDSGLWQITTGTITPQAPAPEVKDEANPNEPAPSPATLTGEPETGKPQPVPGAFEKFQQICRSAGIQENFLKAMADHVFLGDVYDLNQVWESLQGMYLRPDVTRRIFNFWSRVIDQPIPTALVPQVMPSKTTETAKEAETKLPTRFTIIGEEIVPDPEGEFTFAQARQVLMAKAIQGAVPAGTGAEKVSDIISAIQPFLESQRTAKSDEIKEQGEQSVLATVVGELIRERGSGSGQQPLTLADMLTVVDKIDEARRSTAAAMMASRGDKPKEGSFDELERMVNMMDKMKHLFGGSGNGNQGQGVTIAVSGADGKTAAIPLDTYFALDKHQREVKREDEDLDNKRETGKSIRGFMDKISKAASNLASR